MRITQVKEVMTPHPALIPQNTTLMEASAMMRDVNCGVLPVGREDKIKGVITDRDIVVRAVARGKNAAKETVADYMTTEIYDCRENDSIESAVDTMRKHKVGRLVVRNNADKATGILSFGDVLWRGPDVSETTAIVEKNIRRKFA